MKITLRQILAMAAALCVTSCGIDIDKDSERCGFVRKDMSFEASLGESGARQSIATKTSVVMKGGAIDKVQWSPGDEINVYYIGSGGAVSSGHFTNSETASADKASFHGSIGISTGTLTNPVCEQMFWAVYPYSANNSCDGVSVTIPDAISVTQKSLGNSFADGQWPTMARSNGLNLPFYAICSGIKFQVSRGDVTSVTFRNLDGMPINGDLTATWGSDGKPQMSLGENGSDKIVVTPKASSAFSSDSVYFVVLPVMTMTEGFEVTFKTPAAHCTATISGAQTFARNQFRPLSGIDTNYETDATPTFYRAKEIEAGKQYAIYSEGYLLTRNGTAISSEKVTLATDNTFIHEPSANMMWTVESSSKGYAFANDGYRLTASGSGYYSTLNLSNAGITDGSYWTISDNFIVSSYLSSNRHLYYSSNWKIGSSSKCTYFYTNTPPKTSRGLAFANSSMTVILGETPAVNALSGATSGVKYSSSSPGVADVNQSTGALTIHAIGTTTITASAEEDGQYESGSASYTLNVKKEDSWNLENSALTSFLDEAESKYTDDNWGSVSVVTKYSSGRSQTNRLDCPAPVKLNWTATSGSGNYEVKIYNDAARTELETSLTSTTNSADIYNLIPNKTYYYSVSKGSSSVKSGEFSTTGRRRMMKVSDVYARGHANNCRDLGGMVTTDGHTLKYSLIFRGTNMDATSTEEKQYLTGYMGLKLDVDLRNGKTYSTPGNEGSTSLYQPFGSEWSVSYTSAGFNSWSDLQTTSKINTIFSNIISTVTSGKACYIHCYVGADRTGYICMLIEAVLGVSPKDCSIDYELTSFSVEGTRTRTGTNDYYFSKGLNYINGYTGDSFQKKAENILLDAGITSAQITSLRNAMIE